MGKKHFYSHLIEIDSLVLELSKLDMSDEERLHLISIVESSLHHTILDAILSELSEEDKKKFLTHVAEDDHDKIWKHLNETVNNIEEKIVNAGEKLKKELHMDISDSQR